LEPTSKSWEVRSWKPCPSGQTTRGERGVRNRLGGSKKKHHLGNEKGEKTIVRVWGMNQEEN